MKTADRVLAEGLEPPFTLSRHRALASTWVTSAKNVREHLRTCPVIVADNVAAYSRAHGPSTMEDYPCLAPPWPLFWIEYISASGRQRRAVMVYDVTDDPRAHEGIGGNAVNDAKQNGFEGEPRWVVGMAIMAEDERHVVTGPVGWFALALDDRGLVVGNRWMLGRPDGPESADEFKLYNGSRFNADWLMAAIQPALQTIAFLHCRNVARDTVTPPEKLSAKHRRKYGEPLIRYQQVRLELPRASSAHRGGKGGNMGPPSLHIVAGHFAHYGDCHPPRPDCTTEHGYVPCRSCGGHDPHGLLFGRHEGVYWLSQTSRGNPQRGQVKTDFEVTVNP